HAVVQDVGVLRGQRAVFQVVVADEPAQGQDAAVDGVHHGAAGRLPVQMRQAAAAAEHAADGAALGQVAALGHDQVGGGRLQRQRELYFLVPGVVGGVDAQAALCKDHRP